jgi:hypothetical protein
MKKIKWIDVLLSAPTMLGFANAGGWISLLLTTFILAAMAIGLKGGKGIRRPRLGSA